MISRVFTLLLTFAAANLSRAQYTVSVAAGNGPSGLPASQIRLSNPRAVTVDGGGNLIVATTRNIFRVDRSTGTMTLLIGSNAAFLAGNETVADLSNALTSHFEGITAVASDGQSNIYFVDALRRRIYRYAAQSGQLQHWAWGGTTAFNGDGIDARTAGLEPRAIACDKAGTLYIAEAARVRKIDGNRTITTYAGNGAPGDSPDGSPAASRLNDVTGVTVDGQGNVYFSERRRGSPGRVRRLSGNSLLTVAGGLANTNAVTPGSTVPPLEIRVDPTALGTDGANTVFVFETNRIIRLDPYYGQASWVTVATGPTDYRSLAAETHDGIVSLYFTGAGTIQRFSQGAVSNPFGTGLVTPDNRPARGAVTDNIKQIHAAPDGTLYIADPLRSLVRSVRRSDGIATNFYGGALAAPGCPAATGGGATCITPGAMAIDSGGKLLVVRLTDISNPTPKLLRVTSSSTFEPVAGAGGASGLTDVPALLLSFSDPQGVAVDAAGRILITDRGRCILWRISGQSASAIAGTGACSPGGDNVAAASSTLEAPTAVTSDRFGNVYFIEQTRHRVRRIDTNGILTTIAGTGSAGFNGETGAALATQLNDPAGLAVDEGGNLYISDKANRRIRKVSGGTMTTIAGNGVPGTTPLTDISNGIPYIKRNSAAGPVLCSPESLSVAPDLTVYVADSCNNQVVAVNARIAVTSNPPGLSMKFNGARFTTPAVFNPELGTTSTIDAGDYQAGSQTGTRWKFDGWGSRGAQPTISVGSLVEPQFARATYTRQVRVTSAVTPEGAGSVEASPASPDGYYPEGTEVTLTATPASGYAFDQFSFIPAASPAMVTATNPVFALAGFVSNAAGYEPFRINVGGPRMVDSQGRIWQADPMLALNGLQNTVSTLSTIAVPAGSDYPPDIYRTMRVSNQSLGYALRVPNGQYLLRLKFAEIENQVAGQRVFDVQVQGTTVLQGFDIRRAAGGAFRAIDLVFPVVVTSGELSVNLLPVAGQVCLAGVQIEPYAVAISLSPAYSETPAGTHQQIVPLVAGTGDTRVVWSLEPAYGTIDESGLYTAPETITQKQLVSVIATSVADPARSARADILLTPGWRGADVGTPLGEGSHSVDSGTFQVAGSGKMGGTSDSFRFVYQAMENDGSLIARVSPDSRKGARAGIMIRESLDANARHASLLLDKDLNLLYTARTNAGENNSTVTGGAGAAWLRLVRKGGWMSAYYSLDGQRWAPAGSWTDFGLSTTPYAGLVVSSDLEPATATFDNVKIAGAVAVSIAQGGTVLAPGQSVKFRAETTGANDEAVTWSLFPQAGSIDADGVYTAPASLDGTESVTITANSNEDAAAYATTVVRFGEMRPLLIDAGGTGFTAADGAVWNADANFQGGRSDPARTVPARSPLYATARTGGEPFFYQFFVPNGAYRVVLRFAEWDPKVPAGSRIFNVNINGATVLPGFDIMGAAGAAGAPADRTIPVTVTDGQLVIGFDPIRGKAAVQAIEVYPE